MKISVIIPVYNAAKYVSNAVESALKLEDVYEIILIEDQSPDNALEICRELVSKYDKVSLFRHPDYGNHGAGLSRNLGMEKATGDFIAFLDADDYYLPNRFDREKELFKDERVEGVYNAIGVCYYSEKAKKQYYTVFGDRLTTVYQKHHPKDVFPGQLYMRGSFGLFSIDGLTIRKNALVKMDVFFKALKMHEDTEFLLRLSYYLDLYSGRLDEAVAIRGVHEDNRITKVETKTIDPVKTRILLWQEVKDWAEKEKLMPEDVTNHINRMHRSFEIANTSALVKWGMILKYLILDYKSIRSGVYNINFLQRNSFFFKIIRSLNK